MQHKSRLSILIALSLVLIIAAYTVISAQEDVAPMTSNTSVHLFSDASAVEDASSSLTRYEEGVIATLHTSNLTAGEVVTMWWVVFNEPANCSDACGEDDIFLFDDGGELVVGENGVEMNFDQIEAAQIALVGATGNVIGADGAGHFSAVLSLSNNPNLVFGPGLFNPMSAEIHLILRTHGEMNLDMLDEQIVAFNGGCAAEWPNEPCSDVQFAVHLAQ